jgi:hypothetical protein
MQEFSSVSASAYDAESLTTQLNEKSADGWDVVSIVSAGSNVVAYLSRESTGEVAAAAPAEEAADTESPVEEPSGWAVADPTPSDAAVVATAAAAADVAAADEVVAAEVVVDDVAAADVAAADDVVAEDVAAADVATVDDAVIASEAESAVPAGWYSDPSGRFELRYWDGAAWTEHVSRAGQQYTDPPVA